MTDEINESALALSGVLMKPIDMRGGSVCLPSIHLADKWSPTKAEEPSVPHNSNIICAVFLAEVQPGDLRTF